MFDDNFFMVFASRAGVQGCARVKLFLGVFPRVC